MGLTKANAMKEIKRHDVKITTSWDDGSVEDLRVLEILKQFGVEGTFYITLDYVGEDGYMDWKQLRAIDADPLFEIGSHTCSHPADMKMLFEEDLHYEVQNSKDLLESVFGHHIRKFCYPRGRHNGTVREMVAKSGYESARTTLVGHIDKPSDPFQTHTTAHVFDGRPEYKQKDWLQYAKEQFDRILESDNPADKIFHLWGHGWEIEKGEEWDHLREFFEYASSKAQLIRPER